MLLGRARFGILDRQPYPLSFVTVSGVHLCDFPSERSDFGMRGGRVCSPFRHRAGPVVNFSLAAAPTELVVPASEQTSKLFTRAAC